MVFLQATKNKQELSFYSLPEFEEWKKQTESYKTWHIKYYKGLQSECSSCIFSLLYSSGWPHSTSPLGLGTSTSKEAKEYFADMERHRITFRYQGAEDDAAITLVSFLARSQDFSLVILSWVWQGGQNQNRSLIGLQKMNRHDMKNADQLI